MQTPSIGNSIALTVTSILKSANEEPKLAGELITKTVEAMVQIPMAGTQVQQVAGSDGSTIGNSINITA